MEIRYFAWVREKVGCEAEDLDVPSDIQTVAALIKWLVSRGENYAEAFADEEAIRVALDQEHVEHDARITPASEIAFFPPMTGG
ncbi:MAG: molybdopterin converting factor subunit 1 [Rhodobacteraceae bacterium]|nr:molybdopterin converting factor subunit 1 [Paracoccaceae bacterium]